jgi:cellulose synthase operon protein YhjQ
MKQDRDDMGGRDPESGEPADDVATLYSWANLHGAKYKDFSASREQVRAQMRQRTLANQALIAREEAQKAPPRESLRWEDLLPGAGSQGGGAGPVRHELPAERRFESQEQKERAPSALPAPAETGTSPRYGLTGAPYFGEESPDFREKLPGFRQKLPAEPRVEPRFAAERTAEPEAVPVRPAWLAEAPPPVAAQIPPPAAAQTPGLQLPGNEPSQQSHERGAPRWYALRGIFGRDAEETQTERVEGLVPVLTFFSLAGGVGKTSLVAGVGRALAGRGERVLLTDTNSFGVLPFHFGAREVKPGVLRTFSGWTNDPPIRVLTLEAERYEADPDLLRREMTRGARDVSRVLIDIGSGSVAMLRQAMRLSPTMLVPMVPDLASVATLPSLEVLFREGSNGKQLQPWYVLNQFDPSSTLQLDVRDLLREQLGERLLPFAIHRSSVVSEALAEGMTVLDYAPNSPAAEDLVGLVTWIRNTSVAIDRGHRGMRWSER